MGTVPGQSDSANTGPEVNKAGVLRFHVLAQGGVKALIFPSKDPNDDGYTFAHDFVNDSKSLPLGRQECDDLTAASHQRLKRCAGCPYAKVAGPSSMQSQKQVSRGMRQSTPLDW